MGRPAVGAVKVFARSAGFAAGALAILFLTVGGAVLAYRASGNRFAISHGPAVTQLEKIGDLTVLRVHVSDVLEAQEFDYRGAWLIKGDALLSVDLRQARILEKDEQKQHAVIWLPEIRVIQPRVDFDKTKTWVIEKVTLVPFKGDPDKLRDSAMVQAQHLVEEVAHSRESVDQAKANAETLIRNLYGFVNWDVEVKWADAH